MQEQITRTCDKTEQGEEERKKDCEAYTGLSDINPLSLSVSLANACTQTETNSSMLPNTRRGADICS